MDVYYIFSLTRLDICYVVQHLSQYVQSPCTGHFNVVIHVLKYWKRTLNLSLFYLVQQLQSITGFSNDDWGSCVFTRCFLLVFMFFSDMLLLAKKLRNMLRFLNLPQRQNISTWLLLLPSWFDFLIYSRIYKLIFLLYVFFFVITSQLSSLQPIFAFMNALNIWRLVVITLMKTFRKVFSRLLIFHPI